MKRLLSILAVLFAVSSAHAQKPIFADSISLPEGYSPTEFVMPPSPLTTQVVFVGGHDIVQTTPTYGNPSGRAISKEWNDFIGFTPDDSDESLGWVTINHEQIYQDDRIGDGGGMTAFRVKKNAEGLLEVVPQTLEDGRSGEFFNVDFVNTVGETGMNCGGINGPNGRIWTAEEWYRKDNSSIYRSSARTSSLPLVVAGVKGGYGVRDTAEFTIDAPEFPLVHGKKISKHDNFNYMTEIDPKQAKAIRKQYNWGRAGWEGGAMSDDGKYVYLGIDGSPAPWTRFIADTPYDYTKGTLQVYKADNAKGERWIDVPHTEETVFGGLTAYAWSVGATMYVRNEWVTMDQTTGIVYWTETGRDSGSSGPGKLFKYLTENTKATVADHHTALAKERGFENALDENYQDYYGRVMYYDPATEEAGVVVNGGPYFEASPSEAEYPNKHLSNPDGLSIMTIGGEKYLVIQEDLNGTSYGRTPEGVSNRICELYLLSVNARNASVDDLTRITAIPRGAEITGAIQIDENTLLVNAQHPNPENPFPYNHSVTIAIHGFADVVSGVFDHPTVEGDGVQINVYPNPTVRSITLSERTDFAIYDVEGRRVRVYRNAIDADVSELATGAYFIKFANGQISKLVVQ